MSSAVSRTHDLSSGPAVIEQLHRLAAAAVPRYGLSAESRIDLLLVSENATFLITDPLTGKRSVLRVHRRGYHGRRAIESELAWLSALRSDTGLVTPRVVPSLSGARVVQVDQGDCAGADGRSARLCVMFEHVTGAAPPADHAGALEELGALTAQMHQHARGWRRPESFYRFRWDYDAAFGAEARWGRWQDSAAGDRSILDLLGRAELVLRRRLQAFGSAADRFGLIHADLRAANLLVEPGGPSAIIDFDDCGFGWYLYDAAAAVSFLEDAPQLPQLLDAWLSGYRRRSDLSSAEGDELATFVMYRRLLLTAWIGTHSAADPAKEFGAGFTQGTCEVAERYLGRFG